MTQASETTLGDFGAGGRPSRAGDDLIDRTEAAQDAAAGAWEFLAEGADTIGWHVPDTNATLRLTETNSGWQLSRATRQRGPRQETLQEGLDLAAAYMADHPEGKGRRRAWRREEDGDPL